MSSKKAPASDYAPRSFTVNEDPEVAREALGECASGYQLKILGRRPCPPRRIDQAIEFPLPLEWHPLLWQQWWAAALRDTSERGHGAGRNPQGKDGATAKA